MNAARPLCVCLILMLNASTAAGVDGDAGFERRKQRLLQVAAEEPERNLFTVTAKLMTGTEPGVALAQLDSLTTDRAIGGMFYAYGMMGVYLHTRHLLPDSLQRKIRDAYRRRTMYRGDTENHWVMYYAGMYLAAQTWPGEDGTRWFNGKSSRENFTEAKEWLLHWMEITSTVGQGEFDSPTYMAVFICPLLVLHDFAADPLMKTRSRMMLDLLLADFAAEHLEGSYGGAHSRDYPEDIINPLAAPSTMWSWLYFGKPEFELWNLGNRSGGIEFLPPPSCRLPHGDRSASAVCPPGAEAGPQYHPLSGRTESAGGQIHVRDAGLCAGVNPGGNPAADSATHMGCDVCFGRAQQHAFHPPPVCLRARAGDVFSGRAEVSCRRSRPLPQGVHESGQMEFQLTVRTDIPAPEQPDCAL